MFYLTTHSTHFIYGYMASDIWLRTILIVRKETRCRYVGYSYRLTARVMITNAKVNNSCRKKEPKFAIVIVRTTRILCYVRSQWRSKVPKSGGAHRHVIYVPSIKNQYKRVVFGCMVI